MKRSVLVFLLVGISGIHIRAQSIAPGTLNAAGGTGSAGSTEFDWSVGEMTLVSTFSGSSVVVTQGVLQPSDAWPADVKNTVLLKQLQVFPNPASSVVNMQYTASVPGKLNYRLMDMAGKVLSNHSIDVKKGVTDERIDISSLACATYMLEVSITQDGSNRETTSYKIQKIK